MIRLDRLSAVKKAMLGVAGVVLVCGPMVFGQRSAGDAAAVSGKAWRFEVVSIRQNTVGERRFWGRRRMGTR